MTNTLTEKDCLDYNQEVERHNACVMQSLRSKEQDIFARRAAALKDGARRGAPSEMSKYEKELTKAVTTHLEKVKRLWSRNPEEKEGVFLAVTTDGRRVEASYYRYRNIVMIQGDDTRYSLKDAPIMFWGARIGNIKLLPFI